MQPVQIVNQDEEEKIEIPLSEYESIKAMAAGIAEQNAAVQKTQTAILEGQTALAENITALLAVIKDGFVVPAPVVNITMPEQPAPVVNVAAPEQPAPVVNFVPPAEGKRKMKLTAKRDGKGFVTGFEGTTE